MSQDNIPEKAVDYLVSKEEFTLVKDASFGYLCTEPQPKNLSKYYESSDYISHTDSKRSLFERLFQFAKSINLKRKFKLINSFEHSNKRLLDIGCGAGDFVEIMTRNHWSVSGIEPNEGARNIASKKSKARFYEHIEQLESSSKFDVITLWHVLEHLPNLHEQIEKISNHLDDDGTLVIAVPNHKSFDASFYKKYWAAYDVPRHLWHFDQLSFSKLMKHHSFIIETTKPMLFDAYYVSLLSEKYKNGWKNFFSAFFVASRSNMSARSTGEYSSLIYVLKKSRNLK